MEPVRCRLTNVVFPVPPSPTRTSLKVGISSPAILSATVVQCTCKLCTAYTYINFPYQSYVLRWTIEGIPTLIDINRGDELFYTVGFSKQIIIYIRYIEQLYSIEFSFLSQILLKALQQNVCTSGRCASVYQLDLYIKRIQKF